MSPRKKRSTVDITVGYEMRGKKGASFERPDLLNLEGKRGGGERVGRDKLNSLQVTKSYCFGTNVNLKKNIS